MKRTVERKYRRGNPSCAEVDGSVEDENTERRKKLRAGGICFLYLSKTHKCPRRNRSLSAALSGGNRVRAVAPDRESTLVRWAFGTAFDALRLEQPCVLAHTDMIFCIMNWAFAAENADCFDDNREEPPAVALTQRLAPLGFVLLPIFFFGLLSGLHFC